MEVKSLILVKNAKVFPPCGKTGKLIVWQVYGPVSFDSGEGSSVSDTLESCLEAILVGN